jgi:hypothetical protein
MHPAKAQRQLNYSIARQTSSLADIDLPVCHGTGINDPLVTLVDMLVMVRARMKDWPYSRIRGMKNLLAREFAYGMVLGLLGRCGASAILFILTQGCNCLRSYKTLSFLLKLMLCVSCHCFDLAMNQDLRLQLCLRGTPEEVCLNTV